MPSEPAAESRWSSAMREALADAQSPDAPFGVNLGSGASSCRLRGSSSGAATTGAPEHHMPK